MRGNPWARLSLATIFLLTGCAGTTDGEVGDDAVWTAALSVAPVAGTSYDSSSKLSATWTASEESADHCILTASESVGGTSVSQTVSTTESTATITGLKSGTAYTVSISCCVDADCAQTLTPDDGDTAASGQTAAEYWQLQGNGASVTDLTPAVEDGNSKISALFYGADAGVDLAGKVQLYYGPLGADDKGLAVGVMADPLIDDPASAFIFSSLAGEAGLLNPSTATSLIQEINTGQGVPLDETMGGKIRLFFEATGSDNRTRVLFIDSQDGYVGLDFNADTASATCSLATDYGDGGGCVPTVAIGVQDDTDHGNANIRDARQFKVGWPTLDNWRWDGASGTFMIVTADLDPSCTDNSRTDVYAVWNGTDWVVQYDDTTGCPRFFTSMQAPTSVHVGGAKYKSYYGDTSQTDGQIADSPLPYLGPKKVIYADGAVSGESGIVDFDDWESQDTARDLHFLWPDGTEFSETEEGYIDDFMMMAPTQDLDFQVMYMAITDGSISPFSAGAVLVNP